MRKIYAVQWLCSLLFVGQMYLMMFLMSLWYIPWALVDRRGAYAGVRTYCRWVRFSARWMVGLRSEVRGTVPDGEVIVASKHQSFFDVIMLVSVLPRPKFIMKASLKWAPFLGWFGMRIGCVPVKRGQRSQAIKQMVRDVTDGRAPAGQLIIYPQGTRVLPGVDAPYKVGTAALYHETGQICAPVAVNVGLFWPRYGIYRHPGKAVIEFLEPIPPGLNRETFLPRLKDEIETRSDALLEEGKQLLLR